MKNEEVIVNKMNSVNMFRFIKQVLRPYYHAFVRMMKWRRRIGLHYKDFSIISNNCTGGYVYQYYGISYKTPTEGVYFTTDDYLKLIANPRHYFNHKVTLILPQDSTLYSADKPFTFPVGKIDDIEVYFMHYPNPEEALSKWYRRSKRINYSKLFCLLTENEFFKKEHAASFDTIIQSNSFNGRCLTVNKYKSGGVHVPNVPTSGGNAAWRPEIIVSCLDWKKIINDL